MKKKWYLQTWFIAIMFAFWFFIIPGITGIVLLILSIKKDKLIKEDQKSLFSQIEELKSESLTGKKEELEKINIEINNSKEKLKNINEELNTITEQFNKNKSENSKLSSDNESLLKQNEELLSNVHELNSTLAEQKALINKNNESIKLAKELVTKKEEIENELQERQKELSIKKKEIAHELEEKQKDLIILDNELLFQSVGLYTPQYNLTSSTAFKAKLNEIRASQKQMVKDKTAISFYDGWIVEDSVSKGKAMTNDNIKLILRSFNNECEAAISKVKFSNVESMKKRINKSFETLNKLGERMRVSIEPEYLNLKIEELELAYEYEIKKQEEKEEQLEIRERMREEAKALKEIENAKKKIEKEEHHFQNAIKDINEQLSTANQDEKSKLLDKLNALTMSLNQLGKDKEDIANREKNTRAGYVYIISNIGSFGENIYKIGMTRRLNPDERVRELGDASVPFKFDVHAMIFSEDAPSLENALHKKFDDRRVNRINTRKEFFKVSLKEIEEEVKKNFNAVVEFTKIAEAAEYRQSLKMEHDINSSSIAS
ncbi:MAG: DUF4041 domain-containing protein [Clostridium sp.]|jgi:hypothetical protein|uniref:DUF4041 domain-containing protein n=1 Tax=Clostridium sp. TaxID=1506 RepID=UPI0025C0601D|nr:DUF4041 domain-containing protein [Clostridium sp.]MCH3962943.1 DUF4041 domain-containing protein [Clostridium sp.]MCI1800153.1 DUF4041 domain-containing protein [Clostridium sp.]MCI2200148.1 DUF4041 domain-containing protein [Clostridium sp.]